MTIQTTENIENKNYYRFEEFPFPYHEIPGVSLFTGEDASGWIRQDADGVHLRLKLESNIITTPFEINIYRDEEKGSRWVNEFVIDYQIEAAVYPTPIIYDFEITETDEPVNINGVDYENSTTVSFSASLSYFDQPYVKELEGQFVFAENVGIVQTYIKSTASGAAIERSYSISDYSLK